MLKSENDIVLRKCGDLRVYEHGMRARLEHGILTSGPVNVVAPLTLLLAVHSRTRCTASICESQRYYDVY